MKEKRPPYNTKVTESLASKLQRLSQDLPQGPPHKELRDKVESVKKLITDNQALEEKPPHLLQEIVSHFWDISHHKSARSLQTYLQGRGVSEAISGCATVLSIDKIGRYLGLCKDFIKIACRPTLRPWFSSLHLEFCRAYAARRPLGATSNCHSMQRCS